MLPHTFPPWKDQGLYRHCCLPHEEVSMAPRQMSVLHQLEERENRDEGILPPPTLVTGAGIVLNLNIKQKLGQQ